MAQNSSSFTVRYIDVTDVKKNPDMPVVKQYNLVGTPDFVLFNPEGKQVMRGMEVYRTVTERWGSDG